MNSPVRVLHVFGRMDCGGAETMIMNIYRRINRKQVQFDFVVHTNDQCYYDEEIRQLGGKIFRVPSYNIKNHTLYCITWNKFFHEHKEYAIIHSHIRSTASIFLFIAKLHGLKTIAHSHNISSGFGFQAIVKNTLQYPIRYIADYFFACSYEAGIWLFGEKTVEKEKFRIIKNAIDLQKYAINYEIRKSIRAELNIEDKLVIAHIGRFHYQKNHKFLIEVFNEVYKENQNIVLLLIGEGNLKEEIKDKVIELNLSQNVMFLGIKDNINEILQAVDIFLFPSLFEGLGIVLIEAQAAGVPCIVSEGIPEEAILCENVTQISLKSKLSNWVSAVRSYMNIDKNHKSLDKLKENGYDILDSVNFFEKFYLDL